MTKPWQSERLGVKKKKQKKTHNDNDKTTTKMKTKTTCSLIYLSWFLPPQPLFRSLSFRVPRAPGSPEAAPSPVVGHPGGADGFDGVGHGS